MNNRLRGLLLTMALILVAMPGAARGDDGRGAALDYLGRGTSAFRAGDTAGAVQAWSEAIRRAQAAGAGDIEAQALARRGEAYRIDGYFRDAGNDLRAALAKAEQIGDQSLIAAASGALGGLELASGRSEIAEGLLTRSRDLARRLGDHAGLAAAANDLGDLYAAAGRSREAAGSYAEAVAGAQAAGNRTLAATAEINNARLAARHGDPAGAAALLARALDRLDGAEPSYSRGMALLSAGSVALEHDGKLPANLQNIAHRAFQAAARTAETLRNARLASLAQGGLGRLDQRIGRPAEATKLTDRALLSAQQAPAPDVSYRLEWQQARLAHQQGQVPNALASYRRAVSDLQSIRRDIPVEYRAGKSSYRVTFGPLYREFTDLLLRRSSAQPTEAPALISEARDTIEKLKASELEDYYRDTCVADFEARRRSIQTVSPGAAVLYPISLPDRLELLVSFGEEHRQFTIPVSETALTGEVQRFRELLEKRTTNEYLVPARQLYDRLIRPIEPVLAAHRIDTLVIVPDQVLRVVPFAALNDGRNFLIQRYATAIAPSLHLIDPKPLAAGPRLALVLGVSQSVQGFVDLPNVPHEVAAVSKLEGGKTLIDQSFSRASFAGELKTSPYNIVHIASHGQFATEPSRTFVLSYDAPLTMNDLETDIKYGEHRDNPLELLVLSACETASGDDRAALGLAGVALKAGARSALASLWYVSDQAAGELVVDFYRELQKPGLSKAHALQAAQRRLIAGERYAHPAYWAPFLLIGNWL
ncbi:MAG TPA: CHAT domain-containing protein [Stellaceae bacterium]|nr:CHAT domain-containing protein [Stellaceae bacterium]